MKTIDTTVIASAIITALLANNVEPEATHTAAPGRDWGFVAAYRADEDGNYAIQYGDNGTTNYDMTDDIDDLACWLITDDIAADAAARCNARDEDPETVADDYTGTCRIITARDYNSPTRSYCYVMEESSNPEPLEFDSPAAAQQWIDETESEVYRLDHNESGRPDYFIVEA